jgi:hypothetical protein
MHKFLNRHHFSIRIFIFKYLNRMQFCFMKDCYFVHVTDGYT